MTKNGKKKGVGPIKELLVKSMVTQPMKCIVDS